MRKHRNITFELGARITSIGICLLVACAADYAADYAHNLTKRSGPAKGVFTTQKCEVTNRKLTRLHEKALDSETKTMPEKRDTPRDPYYVSSFDKGEDIQVVRNGFTGPDFSRDGQTLPDRVALY